MGATPFPVRITIAPATPLDWSRRADRDAHEGNLILR